MVSQVLSNDQLRAAYDRDGADSSSLESASFVDPALFFNMLFGSDKFEPYVGRLKLAAFASVAAGRHQPLTKSDLRKITTPSKVDGFGTYVHTWIALNRVGVCLTCPCAWLCRRGGCRGGDGSGGAVGRGEGAAGTERQGGTSQAHHGLLSDVKRRLRRPVADPSSCCLPGFQVKCAMHLVTLLDKSVKGDSAGFQTWCEKEAAELANAAFGPTMLIAVRAWGEQYSSVLFTIVSHGGNKYTY